ncbi:hypothetical protein CY35_06G068800 [Sphagnum magellanicum]|nr:hypothetical protein CY35_06G068800 [Sphagnum magellanicum]KAH9559614.1 hypothetical protein CY35_06G068800 [Sphagnum magellanicum]
MLKLIVTAFAGGMIGACIGMFYMRYGVPSSLVSLQSQQPLYIDYRPPAPPEMLDDTLLCSSEIPQGAESLPRDIINSVSDLFPRRLWGRPEEDLPHKPKYLLTLTVGAAQKQGVNDAISKFSKEWQILLFHYDGKMDEWDEFEWSRNAIHIGTRKQAKWWYAKRFLHPDVVQPYEYIFIWDEDLDLEHFSAEKYIELVKKYALEISQPGLDPDRGLTWQMTKRRGDVEVHKTAVEQPGLLKLWHLSFHEKHGGVFGILYRMTWYMGGASISVCDAVLSLHMRGSEWLILSGFVTKSFQASVSRENRRMGRQDGKGFKLDANMNGNCILSDGRMQTRN